MKPIRPDASGDELHMALRERVRPESVPLQQGHAPANGHRAPPSAVAPAQPAPLPALPRAALTGLAGDVVRAIGPQTEAHEAALLFTFLVYFGALVGRAPHTLVSNARHGTNLFVVLVGRTAASRKGSSRAEVEALFRRVDAEWLSARVQSGLSSGEGLISAVRDQQVSTDKDGTPVLTDAGVTDKRLVVLEEEFCGPIKMMAREGNTLSAVVRQAWDGQSLGTMTRSCPLRATAPHICMIGHTTQTELLKYLTETELANGFANRFLWVCVERSKLLPHGGDAVDYGQMVGRLQGAVRCAQQLSKPVRRDPAARDRWELAYYKLAIERPGLFGAVTSRAEAQCLRLSLVYALLDCDPVVRVRHIEAALALWQYCEDSARLIFGRSTGNSNADKMMAALRAKPEGLTLSEVSALFGRNMEAERLHMILDQLRSQNLLSCQEREGRGGGTIYLANDE